MHSDLHFTFPFDLVTGRDISLAGAVTSIIFVATKYACRDKYNFCRDKLTFIAAKDVFCRDKHMFVATKMILVAAPANDS